MPKPKHIRPDEKIGLKITAAQRKLICDDVTCLDDQYANAIRQTPADQPVAMTLDQWDDLGGYIAAEANHTEDAKVRKKLDTIFNRIQKVLDSHTDEEPPKTVKIEDVRKAKLVSDHAVQIAQWTAEVLVGAEKLGIKHKPLKHFLISPSQRDVILLVPEVSEEIKGKLATKKASFTLAEVASMTMALAQDLPDGEPQKQVALLLVVNHLMEQLRAAFGGPTEPEEAKTKTPKPKTSSVTVYQLKIILKETDPPIWRRIQVKDCTLEKLHEHIQLAMGWENSHLHQFMIGGVLHGDPTMICEGFEDDPEVVDSRETRLGDVIPEEGKRFWFEYEYDFGDGWEHEILFEGRLRAEENVRYPLCLEGERACPPEDVGGTYGYQEYLEAMADPKHEQHEEFMEWRGRFNPNRFNAQAVTKKMQRGMPKGEDEE